ncbi:hypothetical protein O181_009295 [Austropuccinia psidii MF-1]|uniref:Uncharacterized protein n=1 Tax=Austropuccinia psidii MF-1 TaxID=1389203 RepID=A0A9Q3BR23_9BASI|nr:hypothetical protein [Austropuccinia psidii MF-1]
MSGNVVCTDRDKCLSSRAQILANSNFKDDQELIEILNGFLILSKSKWSSPSLGYAAATLLIKVNRHEEALTAVIPALIHTAYPKIRQIVHEALTASNEPKATAKAFVQQISQKTSNMKIVANHLGINMSETSDSINQPCYYLIQALRDTRLFDENQLVK